MLPSLTRTRAKARLSKLMRTPPENMPSHQVRANRGFARVFPSETINVVAIKTGQMGAPKTFPIWNEEDFGHEIGNGRSRSDSRVRSLDCAGRGEGVSKGRGGRRRRRPLCRSSRRYGRDRRLRRW